MGRVGVTADNVLVVNEAHSLHPGVSRLAPLVVGKAFVWVDANAHMADRSPDSRSHGAHCPEFGRKGAWS